MPSQLQVMERSSTIESLADIYSPMWRKSRRRPYPLRCQRSGLSWSAEDPRAKSGMGASVYRGLSAVSPPLRRSAFALAVASDAPAGTAEHAAAALVR